MEERARVQDSLPSSHNVAAVAGGEGGGSVLGGMIEKLRDRASLIASFAAEFNTTAAAAEACSKELRLAEVKAEDERKELARRRQELENKWKEVEQMEKAVEAEKAVVEAKLTEAEGREERFERLGNYIQDRVIRVREVEEDVEVKRKQVDSKEEEIAFKSEQMEECFNRFRLREKGFEDQLAEFKNRQAEFQVRLTQLSSKNMDIDDKERRLSEFESKLKLKERGFEQREKEIDDREKRSKEVENRVEQSSRDLQLREKGFRDRFLEFMTKQGKLKDRERETEEKEKCIVQKLKDIVLREVGFQKKSDELELRKRSIEGQEKQCNELQVHIQQCSDDLKVREKRFHLQLEEFKGEEAKFRTLHRAKDEELQRRYDELKSREHTLEDLKVKEKAKFEQLSRDLRLKEKETETREKQIKQLEHEVQECKKRLAQFQVYDSKYKTLKLREMKLEAESKMIAKRVKDLELKEKQLEERHKEVESKEKEKLQIVADPRMKIEPMDSSESSEAEIRFCVAMSGKDLQIFLNERSGSNDNMIDEVENALRLSSDPAKLVLEAMNGFYPPHLKKGGVEFEEAVIRKSCLLLLERLTKVSPEIKPTVRKDAMKLAVDWMTKMRSDAEHSMEVVAVLQLMAAYGLASAFEDDELVSHLGVIAHYNQAPKLVRDLGLADKISSIIQKLLEKKLEAEAARYVSAFGLHTEFPTLALRKDNEESGVAASTNAVLVTSSNAVTSESGAVSGQCSGAKRPRTDACGDGKYDGCTDPAPVTSAQQLKRFKSPAQQPDGPSLTAQQPERPDLNAQQPERPDLTSVEVVPAPAQHKLNLTKSPDQQPDRSNLPAQQQQRLKSPAQQPERLKSPAKQQERLKSPAERLNISGQQPQVLPRDQGCSNPSPTNGVHSVAENKIISSPSKSPFEPPMAENEKVSFPAFVPECLDMGATRLRVLCKKIGSNSLYCREITDALGHASDPAEFVLGVVKNPSTLSLSRGNEAVSLAYPEHGPLLLLNCMWRKQPLIKPDVKRQALSYARDWNSTLVKQRTKNNLDVVCFLLFLAAYKLVSHFDRDDFFVVFDKGHWCEYATKLFGFLGFQDFIPKFLEYLMRNKQQIEVLKCIIISNLLDKSPSVEDLVRQYLLKLPKKVCKTGSITQQIQQLNREIKVWRAVVQSIDDQKLVKNFRAHISTLFKQKGQKQNTVKSNAAPKLSDQQKPDTDAATVSTGESPRETNTDVPAATTTCAPSSSAVPQLKDESPQVVKSSSIEPQRTQWSSSNTQPPPPPQQPPLQPMPSGIHYPNPPYGFPAYPHGVFVQHQNQVPTFFPHSSYQYPGYGRSVPY
ncbi:FRIGIDA-like protein 5 [Linum perenne]